MKALLHPSLAAPTQIRRLFLLPAGASATSERSGLSLQRGLAIRLLTVMLLLCGATSASADLSPSPSQLDFQEQALGITSPPLATTLSNTGNQSVTVTAVSPATGVYARAGGSCGAAPFTIAAQATCTIEHTFTPDFLQIFYQTINLTVAGGAPVAFGLRGVGASGQLVVSPSFLNWFSVPVGAIGTEQLAYINNEGPVPLTITEITTTSVPPVSAFVRTGGSCPPPPFQLVLQCSLLYTFVPAQVGVSTMDVFINSGGGSRNLDLRGEGIPGDAMFKNGFE